MSFVHLCVHTEYSLLEGLCRIKRVVRQAKLLGQTALAITDKAVMYGAVEFYLAAKEAGIKPIIGCDVYIEPEEHDRSTYYLDIDRRIVLLCENDLGYQNLIKLVSLSKAKLSFEKPKVNIALLKKYHEGIIAIAASLDGEIQRELIKGDYNAAKAIALEYRSTFGENNFFLGLQDHGIDEQKRINPYLIKLSKELNIPLAATNDCYYIKREDSKFQKVLFYIKENCRINESNSHCLPNDEFYLKSEEEMRLLFPHNPEVIENTAKIAERCNVEFEFGKLKLPRFNVPGNRDHTGYFREKCYKGLYRRYGNTPDKSLKERLEYEIETISRMGYVDYFLIVCDYVSYAKKSGIPVGIGRGSGAGSLAAYCIGITGIDPIKYDLLFERFLNPERVSMPDFDIDFCKNKRQQVIDYVIQKYGSDHVAQIISFGTLAPKAAIKDVGRVLGIGRDLCDKVARLIPYDHNDITIRKAIELSEDLRILYKHDESVKELLNIAHRLEGLPRHTTTHAAGVVITDRPVSDYVPLAENDGAVVTQYTMTTLEKLGLLKMDFLGLRTLTVLDDTEKNIRKSIPDFSVNNIPDNDSAVFKMLSRGDSDGVFQFESKGIKNVLRQLGPGCIEDLIAVLSLYRPGPMDSIPRYIKNRKNPAKIIYKHPLLKPILEVTYGCIVYQEQVMQIFRTLAGYSLGRADIVRRAMSKKNKSDMEKERSIFINGLKDENGNVIVEGCIRRGVPSKTAEKIFSEMESFASYAFNRSHAACYALIAYQTAYLKCHYPREYFAALITSVIYTPEKAAAYIDECERRGIKVLPPNVNESFYGYTVEGNGIRMGLRAIRMIGKGLICAIIRERRSGKFTSFYDFCKRIYGNELSTHVLRALIYSGALDGMGANRREMDEASDRFMYVIAEQRKNTLDGQIDLYGSYGEVEDKKEPDMYQYPEYSSEKLLDKEKEYTGLYLTGHPLMEYRNVIYALQTDMIKDILSDSNIYFNGKTVDIIAMIVSVDIKKTRRDQRMAFIKIEDRHGMIEMLVFASELDKYGKLMMEGNVVRIKASISRKEGEERKLLCKSIHQAPKSVSELSPDEIKATIPSAVKKSKKKSKPGLYIRVPSKESEEYIKAKWIVDSSRGSTPLYILFMDSGMLLKSHSGYVEPTDDILKSLKEAIGSENVILV